MKKKIIFIVNHAAFFCSHRLPIALEIIKNGCDFHLIIGEGGSYEMEIEAIKILKKNNISYSKTIFSPQFSINILKEIFSIFQIIYILINKKADIVHLISPKAILFGGFACYLAGIKNKVFAISGLGFFYTGKENFKKKFLKIIYFFFLNFFLNARYSKTIIQNYDDFLEIKKIINIRNQENLFFIPGSGVNHNNFKIKNFIQRKKIVLMTSRILVDKGVIEFFKAAKILKKKYKNWKFILVGALDYQSPSAINEKLFKKLLNEKNVEWAGYKKDIFNYLNKASIFCLPSYREGMSKSLIEAAMSGLPIVTTNVPGCRDVVKKNITGILVEPKNHIILSQGIEKLILNPKLRYLQSKRARIFAKNKFSLFNVVNETMKIYKNFYE